MGDSRGFSLLEAVVAVAIVALAGVSALAAFGTELRAADRAGRALEANALAEERLAHMQLASRSELERLGDSLRRGRFAAPLESYRWDATSRMTPGHEDLFDLTVAIQWEAGAYSELTGVYRPPSPAAP